MRLDSGAPLCLCFAASDFARCDSFLIWGSEFDFPPFCTRCCSYDHSSKSVLVILRRRVPFAGF